MRKIHFIHQLEKLTAAPNLGDWLSSPYYYFIDFFSKYTCVLHSIWAIHWHEIEKDDVVIIGGGGCIDNSDDLNEVINHILDNCNNVIFWGVGVHKFLSDNKFNMPTASKLVRFEKAALCGLRDYDHPYKLPFVPCVSCLHPAFDTPQKEIKRELGVMVHGLDDSFGISGFNTSISNSLPINTIVDYNSTSKIMLVKSYHGAYWTMLLGRKAIIPEIMLDIDKYRYFKYPPGIYTENVVNLEKLLEIASEIPGTLNFLDEARKLNIEFFDKVKTLIEDRITPSSATETIQIQSKRIAQLEFTILEISNELKRLNKRIVPE